MTTRISYNHRSLTFAVCILIYFSIHCVLSNANSVINVNLEYQGNDTLILFYNLTTNYSYFITFRSFGNEQSRFGLFPPTQKFKEGSIEILHPYPRSDLFIVCFHFILQLHDLDIQCRDQRVPTANHNQSNEVFLPSYNPLFVPMMYALSILMLLPIIIQQHRRKRALVFQRHKELRRLSVSISQDKRNPKRNIVRKILSQIAENGTINYDTIPADIELASVPSTKIILDDLDENPTAACTLDNLQPFIQQSDEKDSADEIEVDAHDCIAHLLDHTPWNRPSIDQPFRSRLSRQSVIHDCTTVIKEQHVPTIISFQDKEPIVKSKRYYTDHFHRTNPAFLESDV